VRFVTTSILWGLADPEQMEGVDVEPGDVVVAGCLLYEKNRCLRCGTRIVIHQRKR